MPSDTNDQERTDDNEHHPPGPAVAPVTGVTSALTAALEQRGAEAATAALLAPVGTAIFRAVFDRWAEQPERASLADRIRETAAELAVNMQPAAPPSGHRSRLAAGRAT